MNFLDQSLTAISLFFCTAFSSVCAQPPTATQVTQTPLLFADTTLRSADDIANARNQDIPLECEYKKSSTTQSVRAKIDGENVLLSNVNFGDDISTGMILFSQGTLYLWKDGSTTGWKTDVPEGVGTRQLTSYAQANGLSLVDISSAQDIERSRESGEILNCVPSQFTQETFSIRESVTYTDVTGIATHFFKK